MEAVSPSVEREALWLASHVELALELARPSAGRKVVAGAAGRGARHRCHCTRALHSRVELEVWEGDCGCVERDCDGGRR
ncbi:hypothetical protein E2562_011421 [Oryza meyeriana var. granulata]|uniref:Uncharacterized protein n=1 Tax=Oryza meyeriana var. granulata TaxID=110450 RepID=A0A6G1D3X3_9ORYZ|nr:hypothetical protein E2562_011421 [Oryza meyeriana var. granulata]